MKSINHGGRENSNAAGANGDPPRVLVVDDEPEIVNFLTELLEDEGYDTVSAHDGHEAVSKIRRQRPHVVISDVMMPRFSGHELVRYLHHGTNPESPQVILMSAVVDRSPYPAVPLLQKPFDVDELLLLVDDAVAGDGTREQAS